MKQEQKEIGSEFWLETLADLDESKSLYAYLACKGDDRRFLLSGRTAIDFILQDIERCHPNVIKVAWLPSYGCDSMIVPFIKRGWSIEFYSVLKGEKGLKANIEIPQEGGLLMNINYFGFADVITPETIERYRKRNMVILYDGTHSLLQESDSYFDYGLASIRKWVSSTCGAIAIKAKGEFGECQFNKYPYLDIRYEAMSLKYDYMQGNNVDKQLFLDKYGQFGHQLSVDYANYEMDDISLSVVKHTNLKNLREQRIANAQCLLENFSAIGPSFIRPMFDFSIEKAPLFFPICVNEGKRDALKRFLVSKACYCPNHWPKSPSVQLSKEMAEVYDCELSLICDQRYTPSDMKQIINHIQEFIEL